VPFPFFTSRIERFLPRVSSALQHGLPPRAYSPGRA
jgi:hypothetical protein